jgi:hypothetical protein
MKYKILLDILDSIRKEAPDNYKKYNPDNNDVEKINYARSRALTHLFLKVKFGIIEFERREHFITDGPNDGGIDGYYIDNENREIYIFQTKFRTTEKNYEEKEITYGELLKMDISKITEGEEKDAKGIKYNNKILQFIKDISNIADIPKWKYKIIIIANLNNDRSDMIKKIITNNFDFEVFNHERIYDELVYPVSCGSYFNASEVNITLNIGSGNNDIIDHFVKTEIDSCNITVCFVPVAEIAKIINKYKNSILKYNPRCYLDLKNNDVNPKIENTIKKKKFNEFALFNNGITILSNETNYSSKTGRSGIATLSLKSPQIINGGQTAYTLGRIYSEKDGPSLLKNKEVILKVITFDDETSNKNNKESLIESISKATNQQTSVSDADRHSNDAILVKLQEYIYKTFGYFFERKKGEFSNGLQDGYINRNLIIKRDEFLKIALAVKGRPSETKGGEKSIYTEKNIEKYFNVDNSEKNIYVYAYKVSLTLKKFNSNAIDKYGYSIKYGKYAVLFVISLFYDNGNDTTESGIKEKLNKILEEWPKYELYAIEKDNNKNYFVEKNYNYINYYKSNNLNIDLRDYFTSERINIILNN